MWFYLSTSTWLHEPVFEMFFIKWCLRKHLHLRIFIYCVILCTNASTLFTLAIISTFNVNVITGFIKSCWKRVGRIYGLGSSYTDERLFMSKTSSACMNAKMKNWCKIRLYLRFSHIPTTHFNTL